MRFDFSRIYLHYIALVKHPIGWLVGAALQQKLPAEQMVVFSKLG
jgi:hypothetical protein